MTDPRTPELAAAAYKMLGTEKGREVFRMIFPKVPVAGPPLPPIIRDKHIGLDDCGCLGCLLHETQEGGSQ